MTDQLILFIVGGLTILFGFTGLYSRTRRGRRMVNLLGDTGSRVLYIGLGMLLIIFGLFL